LDNKSKLKKQFQVTGKQPSKKVIETEDKTIRELMLENDVLDPSQIDPRPDSERFQNLLIHKYCAFVKVFIFIYIFEIR
jgi:hypothetical protein